MNLDDYLALHCTPESEALAKINRNTHLKTLKPRMLSGKVQGRFLTMIVQMLKPNFILELGTFTGYSAVCMAEGFSSYNSSAHNIGAEIHTIEANEELEYIIKENFEISGFSDKIHLYIGEAKNIIPTIDKKWDLVFIDADKENYSLYFDLVLPYVNVGGFILVDNVLWDGKVLQENTGNPEKLDKKLDKKTKAIIDFNTKIMQDKNVEKMILPLRDGIFLIRKK